MDPHATWSQLLDALASSDPDAIEELAMALQDWLDRGGYPPHPTGRTDLGSDFDSQLAYQACAIALAQARGGQS